MIISTGEELAIRPIGPWVAKRHKTMGRQEVWDSDGIRLVAQPNTDGGLQYIIVANEPGRASASFEISIDGAPVDLLVWADGSVLVGRGEPVDDHTGFLVGAHVAAPWAFDSSGAEVASWYEADGNTLTLVVDESSEPSYPIVADPSTNKVPFGVLDCGWTSCTYYLERQSTYNIRDLTTWEGGVGWVIVSASFGTACSLLGGPTVIGNIIAGFGCSVFMGIYGNSIARHSRDAGWGCLAMRYYYYTRPPSFDHVHGSHQHCYYDAPN